MYSEHSARVAMASIFKVALYKYLSSPLPPQTDACRFTNTIKQKTAQTKHYKNCHRVNRRRASRVPVLGCDAGFSLWSAAGGWVVSGEGPGRGWLGSGVDIGGCARGHDPTREADAIRVVCCDMYHRP